MPLTEAGKSAQIPVICLAGPTGSGKTALAIEIASRLGGEIINADSRQVYADFPIITAQPGQSERDSAPHHLYGFLPGAAKISAGEWVTLATAKAREIIARNRVPLLTGGTGFYFHALLHGLAAIPAVDAEVSARLERRMAREGSEKLHARLAMLDPDYAAKIHPRDRQRIQRALGVHAATGRPFSWWHKHARVPAPCVGPLLTLEVSLADLSPRLDKRIGDMIDSGAIEEVRAALVNCPSGDAPAWSGIGCAEIRAWLEGRADFAAMRAMWLANTRAYAKRQLTWFRGRPEAIRLGGDTMRDMDAIMKIIRQAPPAQAKLMTALT